MRTNSRTGISGSLSSKKPIEISMTSVGAKLRQSSLMTIVAESVGPFDIVTGSSNENLYPGLWHVNSENQRALLVSPDCQGIIRSGSWDRAQRVLENIGRVHHNVALRFNTNSLAVLFTDIPTIGINLLPTVKFDNPLYDYVWTLWGNSTLGFLCYWMHSNKRHSGRGQIRLKCFTGNANVGYPRTGLYRFAERSANL